MAELTGQVAVVTGGGRGIGRAIARRFAAAGAAVMVTARTADELHETVRLIEDAGGRAVAFPANVRDRAAVEAMLTETERRSGRLSDTQDVAVAFADLVGYTSLGDGLPAGSAVRPDRIIRSLTELLPAKSAGSRTGRR